MVKDKLKEPVLTAFTPNGDYVAILSSNATVKIWNTNSGDLLAEWKPSDGDHDIHYSCIACSFTGKKRKKDKGTCLLALGTDDGKVLAIDVSTGERKWPTSHPIPGGICGLSFAKKGQLLYVVGHDGKAYEINSETGELLKEFRISKTSISSLAFSHDEKYLAIFSSRLRVVSWETGEEVLKCPKDLGNIHRVSISNDAKYIITSDSVSKHLQVWRRDLILGTVSSGPKLPFKHAPLVLDCHLGCNEEDDLVVSAVMSSGGAYIWKNLNASSEDQVHRTKITLKTENGESSKKMRTSIIASRFQSTGEDKQMKALVTYGSVDHPQFTVLNISDLGEDVVLNVGDELDSIQKHDSPSKKAVEKESKKSKKRQATSDPDLPTTTEKVDFDQCETAEGVLDDDPSEPTMGEKLASLNLLDENKSKSEKEQESLVSLKPPSADSVHILLKQALNADDRALLLDCLYTQDEKVIIKSVAQLNPSNVLKLLNSLISIIESRGAILSCALPWLKCLLLQHASGIMSQESSLKVLNSLYQLIESRVSTFKSVFQLSSFLDILYTGVLDEEVDEVETVPIIYVDTDDSEAESEDVMETDKDSNDGELSDEGFDNLSDIEVSDGMMED
ncbi:WD repeat-containing protein 43-like [Trifolium pratense]|uniref:WD repeat-containing protein 43-like n=1 Tax=Trifolium pratense TaxID=57577 RepID=UPI001E6981E1|nr:WD repeat-containing protein 43-like [Trifolium pratense]